MQSIVTFLISTVLCMPKPFRHGGQAHHISSITALKEFIMTTRHIFIVTATVFATSLGASATWAQEATFESPITASTSGLTRQDVHQQAVAAMAQGRIQYGEATRDLPTATTQVTPLTRAEVSAEARSAMRKGLVRFGEA